ncbi:hypothetical protein BD413DRAFT_664315, partial [Trametes elegans]
RLVPSRNALGRRSGQILLRANDDDLRKCTTTLCQAISRTQWRFRRGKGDKQTAIKHHRNTSYHASELFEHRRLVEELRKCAILETAVETRTAKGIICHTAKECSSKCSCPAVERLDVHRTRQRDHIGTSHWLISKAGVQQPSQVLEKPEVAICQASAATLETVSAALTRPIDSSTSALSPYFRVHGHRHKNFPLHDNICSQDFSRDPRKYIQNRSS